MTKERSYWMDEEEQRENFPGATLGTHRPERQIVKDVDNTLSYDGVNRIFEGGESLDGVISVLDRTVTDGGYTFEESDYWMPEEEQKKVYPGNTFGTTRP